MPFASFPRPAAEGMRLCRSVRFRTAAMLLAAALLLFPSLSRADGDRPLMPDWLKLSGSLQTTYRQSPYKATPLSAAQRFRLEANINQDSWIRGYVSGHVDADLSVPGRRDSEEHIVTPELGEAYVTLDSRYLDLIIGMQQIRWGEADSLSTFDIINPVDFRNPIATARSSQRLSVGAVDLRANLDGAGLLDLVLIPFPRFSRLPEYGSPWEDSSLRTLRQYARAGFVRRQREDGPFEPEAAARLKFFRPGYDVAFLFYRGYEHTPLYTASLDRQRMQALVKEIYEPYTAFGINTAVSLWDSTFRGEFTIKAGYPFQSDEITVERRTDYEAILGWDRNFLTNLNVNLQAFFFSHDGDAVPGKDRDRYGISWSVSDKFLDESLTAGIRGEIFASNGDYCVEIFSEYEYSDDLHFLAGYMLFGGDRRNDLGQYDRNDHLYLGVRYSF